MLRDDRVTFDGKEGNNLVFERETLCFYLEKIVSFISNAPGIVNFL